MGAIKVAVNDAESTIIVNREDWNALPTFLQLKLMSEMQEQHGKTLHLKLVDTDPHDDDEDEEIEVDNLLVPDNARAVQLGYPNGGVEVAVITQRGWLRVLESGEHLRHMPTPYFEERPPSVITILSTLPKEGLGNTSSSMMDDDAPKYRHRQQQAPIFLDTSGDAPSISMPDDAPEELKELLDSLDHPDATNVGEMARISFEAMHRGAIIIDENAKEKGLPGLEQAPASTKLMAGYLASCMNYDAEQPEGAWDAFCGALETLLMHPHEYAPMHRDVTDDELSDIAKSGRSTLAALSTTDGFRFVREAASAGKPFGEWSTEFYVLRMVTTVSINELFGEEFD